MLRAGALLLACCAAIAAQGVFVPGEKSPVSVHLSASNPSDSKCDAYASVRLNYTTGHLWGCVGTPPAVPAWVDLTAIPKALSGAGVCGFGDSIVGAGSTDVYFAPTFFNVLMVLSNGSMQFVHQAGVSGNTTAQMLARLNTDVLQQPCSKVILDGGTNDILGSLPLTTPEANLSAIYKAIAANGQLPILCTIPPQGGNYQQVSQLNAWIRSQAFKLNLPLIDLYGLTVDPSTANYRSGYSLDGIHPVGAALRVIATKAAADLAGLVPSHKPLLPYTNTDPNNLLANGLLLNSTGGIATGWSAINSSGHVTYSISTDANVPSGNVQVITKASTAAGDNDGLGTEINSGYVPGDRVAFVMRLVASGIEAAAATIPPAVNVYFYTSSYGLAGSYLAPWSLWPVDIAAGQVYLEATVPAGTAHIDIQFNSGNGTEVYKFGQIGLYNLTQLGL